MTSLVCYHLISKVLLTSGEKAIYFIRVPSDSTDGFSAHIVESQALFFSFDIPYGGKPSAASCDRNMSHISVPIKAFEIVSASNGVAHTIRVGNVVQIGDEKLQTVRNRQIEMV